MIAQFPGTCLAECGERIVEGDEIVRGFGGWRHVECPEPEDERRDREALARPRCARCGTNHPGEC